MPASKFAAVLRAWGCCLQGSVSPQSSVCPNKQATKPTERCNPKSPIFLSCLAVFVMLLITLPLYGYFSYTILFNREHKTFTELFDTLAEDIFVEFEVSLLRLEDGAACIAEYAAAQQPHASQWPNATINHYGLMNARVEKIDSVPFALLPIVQPEEVAGFEEHSKSVFKNTPDVPANAGENPFGYGIFSFNGSIRVHDTTGVTPFSKYRYLTPVLYSAFPKSTASFLFNLHSAEVRAKAMDDCLECSMTQPDDYPCSVLSDIVQTVSNVDYRPNTILYYPIRPVFNRSDIVGFVTAGFKWDLILESALSKTIKDVIVVVISPERTYSFKLGHGESILLGEGDFHNNEYNYYVKKTLVSLAGATNHSVVYKFHLYPTNNFYDDYHSNLPLLWTCLGLSTIIIITFLFILYDRLVKEDSLAKEIVLAQKRQFVRIISHEIRTPLNTVKMGLRLVQEALVPALPPVNESFKHEKCFAEINELNGEIQASVETALSVLNDLLHYDKIQTGKLVIEIKPVPLWKLVQDVVLSFKIDAANKNVNLEVHREIDNAYLTSSQRHMLAELFIPGDKFRLAQTLRNLISNALKFTPKKSTVTVSICWEKNGLPSAIVPSDEEWVDFNRNGSVIIAVKDDGPGISQENQLLLFGEGIQFDANELQGGQGSGLGLFITKGIVERHQGRIWVQSNDETVTKGAVFNIELPVVHGPDRIDLSIVSTEKLSLAQEHENCSGRGSPNNFPTAMPGTFPSNDGVFKKEAERLLNFKILVVDDSVLNSKMLCKLLAQRGYSFGVAGNGRECVDIMTSPEGLEYDCILLDNQMPIMTGPEAAVALRKGGLTIPIYGITGNVMKDDVDHFKSCGVDHIFEKPLDIDLLDEKINSTRHMEC